ncbi:FUSC family protein [Cellulophaga baltica]|uniref:FUSC family protein n=1 Tax=Cellulophaga TaxID=104264 RepID=UPI001C0708B2|nr:MULTISPECIES: FUSC family membrane protein [Cellulophaga]MBU2996983.1 FUSC family protein [Cellulophaga baltica]MDO6768381.1 FUSC family membrane protein [Cellulophaga sp. 1_MG-2023]
MLKEYLKAITLFLKSSNLYRGIVQTIAVITPLIAFYFFSDITYAIPIAIGVFLNAPGNIPGTLKRKTLSTLVSITLTMIVTVLVSFSQVHFALLIATLAVLTFFISLISAYGFRGSLIAFSGLLAIVLTLANNISGNAIWVHTGLIGVGGLWFLLVLFIFHWIAPKKDEDQLISETLYLTGSYLKIRGKLLLKKTKRDKLLVEILKIQTQLNEKHEVLRELLLSERTKVGRTHFDEKRVLIFISLIDILELALANTFDYTKIDTIVNDKHLLKEFKKLNLTMGKHLQVLSEKLINKKKVQSKTELLDGLSLVEKSIENYKKSNDLTDSTQRREAIIILRNLFDYQAQQIAKVRAIRRVMNNVNGAKKVKLKTNEASQFITPEEYSLNILAEHFNINSPIFRHALRLTITVLIGFCFGTLVGLKNPYWIVLTLIVLMRPSYGLTKERSINRIVGTIIGACFASIIIFITSNTIVYMVLATLSLTIALGLIQQSYRSAAAFITINVIFLYALIEQDSLAVIQFRVIDTAIGATLAILANYLIWPTWEYMNLNPILIETIQKNKVYLQAIKEIYHTKKINNLNYKVPRKEAFLAISNLNAAFQRMTQDPKSKQKEMGLIYEIVTLNNTFVSALASMGSFIQNHETTSSSANFNAFILHIENQLENTETLLNKDKTAVIKEHLNIDTAQKALKNSYTRLSKLRDKEIEAGKIVIDKKMRLYLQEAHLIQTQLNWLKVLSEDIQKSTKKYVNMFETK